MKFKTSLGQPVGLTETPRGLSPTRRHLYYYPPVTYRPDLPYPREQVQQETWYSNNKRGRDDGPAVILFWRSGSIWGEEWYRDGKRHRDDGPSQVQYLEGQVYPGDTRTFEELKAEGVVVQANWFRQNKRHRDDGPAKIKYHPDGFFLDERWYRNGKRHRDGRPAVIARRADGSIPKESWYRDGKRHRDDGPAVVQYRRRKVFSGDTRSFEELEKDGAVLKAQWYQDGTEVTRFT